MKLSRRTKSILVMLGGLAVIVLTWSGLGQHYPQINEWLYLPERLYRTLRTLMGSDPVSSSLPPENLPWQLTLVKIVVTLALLAGMYRIAQKLFVEYYTQFRLLFKRNQILVIGINQKGQALLGDLKRTHDTTGVAIELNEDHSNAGALRRDGHLVYFGDGTQRAVLQDAGIRSARFMICFLNKEQTTINVVRALHQITQKHPEKYQVRCFLHIGNAKVSAMLQQSDYFEDEKKNGIDLRFFNHHQMIARQFFSRLAYEYAQPMRDPDTVFRLIIFGTGDTAKALLVQALQVMHTINPASPDIIVYGADAERTGRQLAAEYPGAAMVSSIKYMTFDGAYDHILNEFVIDPPDRLIPIVIVAFDDDSANLKLSLEILHATPAAAFRVFALNYHNDGLNALLRSRQRKLNRLTFFGSLESVCQVELITQERLDITARSIHEDYLQQLAPPQGSVSESEAYKQSWDHLNEEARNANRAQADHIAYKLAMCGNLAVTQERGAGLQETLSLTDDQVQMLAQVEHRRWMAQRYLAGWRYGAQRDDRRRLHPSLVDWAMLSDAEKQKDRDAILRLAYLTRPNGAQPTV
ncbi:hypothetical protein CAP48_19115 [Advenella sp. S44]|uniref:NAD-binding protein n=1 Tax=Advenella sp. S44 TaxID=1982755 RepID=UPI000C2973CB|nr:NAD-binding protein [Advenella sp. S44]PJX20510.1 hypothetical protein CAP48_19115 [Advenella sp. S44]